MHWFFPSLFLIALVLWVGATSDVFLAADGESPAHEATPTDWRQTTKGWQKMKPQIQEPPLTILAASRVHPLVVGCLQVLVSFGALVAFSDRMPPTRRSASSSSR